jgi:hypothetical protein
LRPLFLPELTKLQALVVIVVFCTFYQTLQYHLALPHA